MIMYRDIPVKKQTDLANAFYKNSFFRKQPPAVRIAIFYQDDWQWVKWKEWNESIFLWYLSCSTTGTHPISMSSFEIVANGNCLYCLQKYMLFWSFQIEITVQICHCPSQVWQVIVSQNQCCPVWNRAISLSCFTLQPASLLTALHTVLI